MPVETFLSRSAVQRLLPDRAEVSPSGLKLDLEDAVKKDLIDNMQTSDLWSVLEAQTQQFAQKMGWALSLQMDVDDTPSLSQAHATAVLRIFLEMLYNVKHHAHASRLAVAIVCVGRHLCLSMQDNGVGANLHAFENPHALGILHMREQARDFGGHIQIRSTLGQGTTIILKAELPRDDSQAAKAVLRLKK